MHLRRTLADFPLLVALLRAMRLAVQAERLDMSCAERDGILTIHIALDHRPGFLTAGR